MANYKQEQINGTKWQRCFKIEAVNDLGGIPTITFYEEEVVDIDGENIKRPVGIMQIQYSNPQQSFDLLNPIDDSVVGSMTHQDFYSALYSLYRDTANRRDNPPAPEEEPMQPE